MISCKSCGANMHFDPASQMLKCDYCNSLENPEDKEAGIKSTEIELFDTTMFSCPQCGATLFSDDDTAATFCSYCGSSVIIEGRAVKMKAPSYVIPFKVTKESATQKYKSFIGGSLYAPNYMKSSGEIKKLRGIYMPYWIYEMGLEGPISSSGHTSRRSGDYVYTRNYRLTSDIRSHCNGTSFDASSSFSDELSQSIAPYNFRDSKGFSAGYLSGFYVDSADVEASVYEKEAKIAFGEDIAGRLRKHADYSRYNSSINVNDIVGRVSVQNKEMAYFPVWFIANEHKGYVSYAVINGQTGKVSADIPIDYGKYILGSLIMALPIMAILDFLITLRPAALAVGVIIFAFISLFISNSQMNLLYTRLRYLDDKGLMSVRGEDADTKRGRKSGANKKATRVVKRGSGADSTANALLIIGGILISICIEADAAGGILFGFMIGIVGFIMKFVVAATNKGQAAVVTSQNTKVVCKMPMSEKMKVLIKPIIALGLAFILLLVNPFIDMIYYGIVIALLVLVLFSFKDVVDIHNKLTRRLPRQFGKRGGEESENL